MSWANRIRHPSRTPPMQQVQAAAQNLADQVGIAPGKTRVVFQTVADVALLGTVVISGALAAIHLYRTLFPKHKESPHYPEAASAGGMPPRRHSPRATASADYHGGYEHDSAHSR
jgi:hypothetical protein